MQKWLKRLYLYIIVYGILTSSLVFALIIPVIINSTDFSMFNPHWNGASQMAVKNYELGKFQPTISIKTTGTSVELVQSSFADYKLPPYNSAIVILGPSVTFSDDDANYISTFLRDGGKLFLGDDFGTANSLLEKINSTCRFANTPLLDLAFEKSAEFPVIYNFEKHTITRNLTAILLNYPTGILIDEDRKDNVSIIAYSSEYSWLDANYNGYPDEDEKKYFLPVLVIEKYARGEIILFSDPSALINSMVKYKDNEIFQTNIFKYLSAKRNIILIDESHRESVESSRIAFVSIKNLGFEKKIFVCFLAILIPFMIFTKVPTSLIRKITRSRKREKSIERKIDVEEIVDKIIKRNPTWNKKIITKMLFSLGYKKI